MQVIKKTSAGIQNLSLDAMLLDRRMVFLSGEINAESVELVVKQLLFLESLDDREPVKLILNSPGGEVSAGLMLYDQIRGMTVPIEMYCTRLAASMAAILLAGGKHGRYILRHSQVMIHEPLISGASGGLCGSASSIAKSAESIMKTKRDMVEMLAGDTGRSIEEIEKAVSFDNFMSAEEAVAFGICDAIVDRV